MIESVDVYKWCNKLFVLKDIDANGRPATKRVTICHEFDHAPKIMLFELSTAALFTNRLICCWHKPLKR